MLGAIDMHEGLAVRRAEGLKCTDESTCPAVGELYHIVAWSDDANVNHGEKGHESSLAWEGLAVAKNSKGVTSTFRIGFNKDYQLV